MLKIIRPDTPIRIKKKLSKGTNQNAFPVTEWPDLLDEDIFVEWHNRHGEETHNAATIQGKDAAYLRLWYIPEVDRTCRIVRIEDNAVFEIVNVDDVMNRHQQLEIEVKRYVKG